jgi:chromosome segregation protein
LWPHRLRRKGFRSEDLSRPASNSDRIDRYSPWGASWLYLKRVELFGFKSFAERTDFEFGTGITVIVGPNGSGKSNVADAVRWVLGEQSARELRGSKMEDVIFAGSDGKRPMGFAQVSLIIDNTDRQLPVDFAEMMVTRRVDRAGGSEYFLNQVPCRLKDIHDLFMDTGVGRDSWSVIGQGRIDEILSAKPEERRAIFEEAAGISRYKSRKREAARRLEDTEQNLVRITDIVGELENQIESLKDQAEKAEAYQQLQDELTALDIGLLAHGLSALSARLAARRDENERLQARLQEIEEKMVAADDSIEVARNLVESLDAELSVRSTQVAEAIGHLERTEGRLALVRQQEQSAHGEAQRLDLEMNGLEGKILVLDEELTGLAARVTEVERESERALLQLERDEKELIAAQAEVARSHRTVESIRSEIVALLQQEATLKNSMLAEGRADEEAARKLARLSADQDRARAERETMRAAHAAAADELDQLRRRRTVLSDQAGAVRRQRGALDQKLATLTGRLGRLREQIQGSASRLAVIVEMANQFEGYQKGPRTVLQNRERFGGEIVGSVAELIRTDVRFEKAIEVALGGNIQNIITKTEDGAKAAIEFLKRGDGGRATFLPLSLIRSVSFRTDEEREFRGARGILGVALDLVQYDSSLQPAISSLLGRVLVAEDIDAALAFSKSSGMRYRIVTLDGELLAAGGALTGGSLGGRGGGLLSREREREELQVSIAAARSELAAVTKEQDEVGTERLGLEQTAAGLEQELKDLEARLGQVEGDLLRCQYTLSRWDEVLATHAEEERRLRAESADSQTAARRLEGELQELAARRQALEEQVSQLTALGQQQASAMEERQGTLTQLRVRLAELATQEKSLETAATRLRGEKATLRQERDEKAGLRGQVTERIEQTLEELTLLGAELDRAQETKQALEQERERLQARKLEVQEQINLRDRELRTLRRTQAETQARVGQGEVEEHRLLLELEQMAEQLHERYGLTPADVAGRELPDRQVAPARERAHQLRDEVRELGPVNLAAIEEYRTARERYDFLQQQRADLEEAKASLYRAIEELDRRIKTHFLESFQSIRREFGRVYQELFEGGRADLHLVDENDLLETGIEITAQPPGKKPQTLQALSGGERAMTACALLFALLRVKPSPFVVLDEVEAALDEANVERFGRYLRQFARESQFICITHQRGTMEVADELYGVTMEGSGISKVVSVRLVEAERYAS